LGFSGVKSTNILHFYNQLNLHVSGEIEAHTQLKANKNKAKPKNNSKYNREANTRAPQLKQKSKFDFAVKANN
jgi:hypothetical protein